MVVGANRDQDKGKGYLEGVEAAYDSLQNVPPLTRNGNVNILLADAVHIVVV